MGKDVDRAKILIEALPYIKKFHNKIIVIKYGGSAFSLENTIFQDIVLLKFVGMHPVLVHGGGKEVSRAMERLGQKPKFVDGLRVTDEKAIEVVKKHLLKINKKICQLTRKQGGKAIGFPQRGKIIVSSKLILDGKKDLGFVGIVKKVKKRKILKFIKKGYIPVISSIGEGDDKKTYNINADTVASSFAISLSAEKLIILTDVEGVYKDYKNKETLISELEISEAEKLIKRRKIAKGMIPKVKSCIETLNSGVNACHIISGNIPNALLIEIFTDEGIGTMMKRVIV